MSLRTEPTSKWTDVEPLQSWRSLPAPESPRRPRLRAALVVAVPILLVVQSLALVQLLSDGGVSGLLAAGYRGVARLFADPVGKEEAAEITATTGDGAPAPDLPESPAAAPPGPPSSVPVVEAIRQLQPFVVKTRSLNFREPIHLAQVDDAEFRTRLAAARQPLTGERAAKLQGVMRALGLIGTDTDLAAEVGRLLQGGVPAFYDPKANNLVVRAGQEVTPYVRKVLVHELTAALHDQHFELDRPSSDLAQDEAANSFRALAEGAATWVTNRFMAGISSEDRKEAQDEETRLARELPRDVPTSILIASTFPVAIGPEFVDTLVKAGGQARVTEAFRNPPTTTEQLIVPSAFLNGEGARTIAAPPADGEMVDQGVLGQLNLTLMLSQAVDQDMADEAGAGWGGDHYVAWRNGEQTCVRATITMDGLEDGLELTEALASWASRFQGGRVEGDGPVTVTRCA
jgi:hypothetical protein